MKNRVAAGPALGSSRIAATSPAAGGVREKPTTSAAAGAPPIRTATTIAGRRLATGVTPGGEVDGLFAHDAWNQKRREGLLVRVAHGCGRIGAEHVDERLHFAAGD